MKITIPELSLVILIGASGSGKSTFARKNFQQYEILSSDFCRGLVSDDENNQKASHDAFDVLHYIANKRLAAGKLTVIDATNVQPEDRKEYIKMAREFHVLPVAIVLNLPEQLCHERNQQRPDRQFGAHVVKRHTLALRRSLRGLEKEGFRYVYVLNSLEDINNIEIERQPLWNNRKHERGPFDIIGDIHGCCDELELLLEKLGYQKGDNYYHPEGRKVVFLGDLVDRGARILDTVNLVRNMVNSGTALCVPGNHEHKLLRKLRGKNVKVNHGLEQTLAEIDALPEDTREPYIKELREFIDSLVSHYVLDGGQLVVAHAGMKQAMQGRGSGAVREFALYGETTGEIDEFGLPVRFNWAGEYRGDAMVVYGHTPVPEAEWLNNTIDIDTGCVFGGKLTALRYPEKELVSVPAAKVYCEPVKPLVETLHVTSLQSENDDVLNVDDVLGKRIINVRLQNNITIREENAIAALEVMSRFAANPKWLIYLPPTMSPVETSKLPGYLEHPQEAFAYYQNQGISEVVCEEKHMGSRAVVIVCRDEDAVRKRFGLVNEGIGICYTRTGRKFFNDDALEAEFIAKINQALSTSNFWETFNTDWVCLDCELMPWSAKAQALLQNQYAPVGVSSRTGLGNAVAMLQKASARGVDVGAQLTAFTQRAQMANLYIDAYRRYCWDVNDISDIKLAPFHILATEGAVHTDKTHRWHMEQIAKIALCDPILLATHYKVIDLNDPSSQAEGINWWEQMTGAGGEGMVVKPMDYIVKGNRGIIQPAVKCRGQEYLRIIYGAEYTSLENLNRLRQRGLSHKRSLAMREFALGVESLERFVSHQPLRRIHECVFGILALESEPVDPRL
ncbi:polynucleotide kinase-phosphatase [Dulcicalothrix desertica PCC 7102]|uniref:Polynucleotide kinase-phosphatase n=1 Tax=Dulcicalothrix desertica PCC 7102 TaxID=232991 RepID=A0A3S1D9P8_9CYAN|nr:polynucleotide kinase-phosphatase [Dulcicalothrix desertica]RUT06076.1 polynucleotide kinase-phosphatase [Dulcicalothrix desertica PCC 7102]TWH54261.1 polynucleotide 3'-phosphatase /polynucleotide 5'-hydroxyl-kinase /polynucleotide 2',3'-cyclic phosphate phosphodiesterase [Dulcicalothrix desertica PCC 7102]